MSDSDSEEIVNPKSKQQNVQYLKKTLEKMNSGDFPSNKKEYQFKQKVYYNFTEKSELSWKLFKEQEWTKEEMDLSLQVFFKSLEYYSYGDLRDWMSGFGHDDGVYYGRVLYEVAKVLFQLGKLEPNLKEEDIDYDFIWDTVCSDHQYLQYYFEKDSYVEKILKCNKISLINKCHYIIEFYKQFQEEEKIISYVQNHIKPELFEKYQVSDSYYYRNIYQQINFKNESYFNGYSEISGLIRQILDSYDELDAEQVQKDANFIEIVRTAIKMPKLIQIRQEQMISILEKIGDFDMLLEYQENYSGFHQTSKIDFFIKSPNENFFKIARKMDSKADSKITDRYDFLIQEGLKCINECQFYQSAKYCLKAFSLIDPELSPDFELLINIHGELMLNLLGIKVYSLYISEIFENIIFKHMSQFNESDSWQITLLLSIQTAFLNFDYNIFERQKSKKITYEIQQKLQDKMFTQISKMYKQQTQKYPDNDKLKLAQLIFLCWQGKNQTEKQKNWQKIEKLLLIQPEDTFIKFVYLKIGVNLYQNNQRKLQNLIEEIQSLYDQDQNSILWFYLNFHNEDNKLKYVQDFYTRQILSKNQYFNEFNRIGEILEKQIWYYAMDYIDRDFFRQNKFGKIKSYFKFRSFSSEFYREIRKEDRYGFGYESEKRLYFYQNKSGKLMVQSQQLKKQFIDKKIFRKEIAQEILEYLQNQKEDDKSIVKSSDDESSEDEDSA